MPENISLRETVQVGLAHNLAPLLPRGIRLNVVSPAPVVDPGKEGKGLVTAAQTAPFYAEAVLGDMTGEVLCPWGGLPGGTELRGR